MKFMKLVTLVLIAVSLNALAEFSGRVDRIDYKTREIVIDDSFYELSRELKVHGANGAVETLFAVKEGMYIRYTTVTEKGLSVGVLQILDGPPEPSEKTKLSPRR